MCLIVMTPLPYSQICGTKVGTSYKKRRPNFKINYKKQNRTRTVIVPSANCAPSRISPFESLN